MNEYTIPKPKYPIYLKLLAGLVGAGLLGLGLVSYHTFNQVHGPIVAAIYAAIIEVGAALDAIGLAGGINRRSWWIIPAVILTIAGSGWYNYAAVAQSGATWGIKDAAELGIIRYAIAWLPLASLSFMALGLGFKIADYEQSVIAWAADRQKWQDDQAERAARRMERKEARQEKAARILESSRQRVEVATPLPGSFQEASRGSYTDFQELLQSNGHHDWKNAELSERFHVSVRTITEWRKKYQESRQAAEVTEWQN